MDGAERWAFVGWVHDEKRCGKGTMNIQTAPNGRLGAGVIGNGKGSRVLWRGQNRIVLFHQFLYLYLPIEVASEGVSLSFRLPLPLPRPIPFLCPLVGHLWGAGSRCCNGARVRKGLEECDCVRRTLPGVH